jgi:hypothetical protein
MTFGASSDGRAGSDGRKILGFGQPSALRPRALVCLKCGGKVFPDFLRFLFFRFIKKGKVYSTRTIVVVDKRTRWPPSHRIRNGSHVIQGMGADRRSVCVGSRHSTGSCSGRCSRPIAGGHECGSFVGRTERSQEASEFVNAIGIHSSGDGAKCIAEFFAGRRIDLLSGGAAESPAGVGRIGSANRGFAWQFASESRRAFEEPPQQCVWREPNGRNE